jgi:hypothetical protein
MKTAPYQVAAMKQCHSTLFAFLLLGFVGSLCAQDAGKNYSYQSSTKATKQSAEEVEDIGEIEEKRESTFREKLRFNVSARAAYTSNALLNGSHSSSDLLFLPTIEAGFHTPLGKHFTFDLAAKIESANYVHYDKQGFIGYSAVATLDYRFKKGLPRVYASLEPYRYDSYDTGDLLSQAIGFTGGTDWGFAFNGGRTLGFVGYSFTDFVSDPNIDSRAVHRVVLGVAHQIRSNITGQLYGVYQYSNFTDFDREDSKFTIAGNLIYQFNQNWFGSLTTAWVSNNSDQENASYESFSTSLGVTFQF